MTAKELTAEKFPFLQSRDIDLFLDVCEQNKGLFYFPDEKELLAFYRFYPELIYAVKDQDFDVLKQCDLTEGPLVYVAALVTCGNGLKTVTSIVDRLRARAYAFHRYKQGEWIFHFVRNNRFGRGMRINYASVQ